MEANRIILDMKYARIIEILAERLNISREEAMDIFYNSPLFELIDKGVAAVSYTHLTLPTKA